MIALALKRGLDMRQRFIPTMVTLVIGAAFGVGFMFSCSDNSPNRADAATCDCAASEPPLAGRFVTVSSGASSIPTGMVGGTAISCPAGSQVISGSCTTPTVNPIPLDLVLMESGFFEDPPQMP